MNVLPNRCDVLVVGAGPSGSACAQLLARAGFDVLLADRHAFPRDKTCGDGLIPDAHAALQRLGVHDEVMAAAHRVGHVACVGPMGGRIAVPGSLAVLPRRQLDDILCRAAQDAGARLLAPLRFEAPLLDGDRVVGARLRDGATVHTLQAAWVVLATGAAPQAMLAAGLCERQSPSGVALRGYVKNDAAAAHGGEMEVVWHRRLRPGYGWIFPCGDGVFNIGVGVFLGHDRAAPDVNLRRMFADFCDFHAPARALMQGGQLQGELKGAPLRCTLEGARSSRAGLLATGETLGSTYAFTGEGIGKAMETGMLAAEALIEARRSGWDDSAVRQRYESTLDALRPRFALYERANRVNHWPWLVELVIWRAKRNPRMRQRMSRVLDESINPGTLFSLRGLSRLLLPGR
jgi:geranylgeranyl reductase family protein